jgi:serine phosphatase RsbU (regulator of sigma subunit)
MLPNIQSCLLPRRTATRFGSVEIAHAWKPLDEIGGDFLYYEKMSDRFLSLEIGDVTGHGVRAGLVMTALHGLIFGLRQSSEPVDRILDNANSFLCRLQKLETMHEPQGLARMLMATMFLLRIDFEARVVTYCNGGHPAALYAAKGAEGQVLSLRTGGPILGAIPTATYRATRLRPAAGDTVLLFTDGLSEAADEAGEEFSVGRLQHLLLELAPLRPQEIVDRVTEVVSEFRGSAETGDDVAVAVLKFGDNW